MKNLKKAVSLILCLTMCLSLFPYSAFAEETAEPESMSTETVAPLPEQVVPEAPLPEVPAESIEEPPVLPAEQPEPIEEAPAVLPEEEPKPAEEVPEASETKPSVPEPEQEEPATEPEQETPEEGPEQPEVPVQTDAEGLSVRVRFFITPEDAELSVYTRDELDSKTLIPREEDGTWLLLPGRYFYSAEAEGYKAEEETEFIVTTENPYLEICIALSFQEKAGAEELEETEPFELDSIEEAALALSGKCGENLTWTLDTSGYLTISGTGTMYNYSSNSLSPWGTEIKGVSISEDVVSIGNYAFYNCKNLTSIVISENVTSIGSKAFSLCQGLITAGPIGSGCNYEFGWKTAIPANAFSGCSGLTGITIPETVTSIGDYAFSNCHYLTDVEIPEGVMSIGMYAFSQCWRLTSITIPENTTSISYCAFCGCKDLTDIILPQSLTCIENNAFGECTKLTSITIPENVTSIGEYAFAYCKSLTSITVPRSVTNIGKYAFGECSCTNAGPSGYGKEFDYTFEWTTEIPENAFFGVYKLKEVTIPRTISRIGASAFSRCDLLEKVYYMGNELEWNQIIVEENNNPLMIAELVPPSEGTCGDSLSWTLDEDGNLKISGTGIMDDYTINEPLPWRNEIKSVEIFDGVTSIGSYAFYNCKDLTYITIPDSITSIGDYAFLACLKLCSIEIPENVTSIGNGTFKDCDSLRSVIIPKNVTSINDWVFCGCNKLTSVMIPDSVTSIGEAAFSGCDKLISVSIPESVISIGDRSFYGCSSLTSITFPESVTNIGERAFINCSSLTSVTIPETVINIGDRAFYGVQIYHAGPERSEQKYDYTFGWTKEIPANAFSGINNLKTVTIPQTVSKIGSSAFKDCNNLEKAYYLGTQSEWDRIVIGENNAALTSAELIPANSGTCGRDLIWRLADGVLMISGTGTMLNYSEDYPAPWTKVKWNNTSIPNINSVIIEEGVTSIGSFAFAYCNRMTKAIIPSTVNCIGEMAFSRTSINSICIPESIQVIPKNCFRECPSLNSVSIPDSVTEIDHFAFAGCTNLMSITIPYNVTRIGQGVFMSCENLADVDLPKSLIHIDQGCFTGCTSLMQVTLPAELSCIDADAFSKCIALTGISIPGATEQIKENAFSDCINLSEITLKGDIPEIEGNAFNNVRATVLYPDGNPSYTSANMLNYGGELTWTKVCILTYDANGGENAPVEQVFRSGSSVTLSAQIPTRTGYRFLGWATSPDATQAEYQAGGSFTGSKSTTLYAVWQRITLASGTASEGIRWTLYEDGELVIEPGTSGGNAKIIDAPWLLYRDQIREVTIREGVTEIGAETFAGCEMLEKVVIPNTVVKIGDRAFEGCDRLDDVTLPETAEIGDGAFEHLFFVPDSFALTQNYLVILAGKSVQLHTEGLTPSLAEKVYWYVEDQDSKRVEDSPVISLTDGIVFAKDKGSAYAVAAIEDSSGVTHTARCRIDVLDESRQSVSDISASLPNAKVTAELLRTDYVRIPVTLNLVQNVRTASVETASGMTLEDSGLTVSEAEFVGGGNADIRDVFGLRVVDDRTLELVPVIDVNNGAAVKAVSNSYRSEIRLKFSDGSTTTTPQLTVTVKKSQPKLTAKAVKLNSFIGGQTVPVIVSGGTVKSFTPTNTLNFARLNDNLTVTVNNAVAKGSGKLILDCVLEDWAVPATLSIPVSSSYQAPKVTLSPVSVTLNPSFADSAVSTVTVKALEGMTHEISVKAGSGLEASYNPTTKVITVKPGSAGAGNSEVAVNADGKKVATLKVKVLAVGTAATLTAKASGTIDTAIPKSPVTLTVTAKNYNAAAGNYRVSIWQKHGKEAAVDVTSWRLFEISQKGNVITLTGTAALIDYVTGYTYTVRVSSDVGTAKDVKITVKSSKSTPAESATIKATGSLDVLRPTTEITVTPTFKNWYDYDPAKLELRLNNPSLEYRYEDGKFYVKAKADTNVDPNLNQAVLVYNGSPVSKAVKLSLKQGKVKVLQDTKSITLLKNDCYSRGDVILSLDDSTLYAIGEADVALDAKSAQTFRVISLGNGKYAIGYKNNLLPSNIQTLKSANIKLSVYLKGNGTHTFDGTLNGTATQTVTVSVKFA